MFISRDVFVTCLFVILYCVCILFRAIYLFVHVFLISVDQGRRSAFIYLFLILYCVCIFYFARCICCAFSSHCSLCVYIGLIYVLCVSFARLTRFNHFSCGYVSFLTVCVYWISRDVFICVPYLFIIIYWVCILFGAIYVLCVYLASFTMCVFFLARCISCVFISHSLLFVYFIWCDLCCVFISRDLRVVWYALFCFYLIVFIWHHLLCVYFSWRDVFVVCLFFIIYCVCILFGAMYLLCVYLASFDMYVY